MPRVTLQTIADRVGVSRTTVSNAYNRPDQLGEDLRARIMAAADELGYRGPDLAARSLRTGRTGTIGLVFTEDLRFVFTDPDTTHFIQGVAETTALARTGLTMLPVPVGFDVHESALMAAPVDGYLVFSVAVDHPAVEVVRSRGVPTVVVDEPDIGDGAFVGIDDRAGARLAAEHLLGLGHARLGVLLGRVRTDGRSGRVDDTRLAEATVRIVRERLAGYRDATNDAGADLVVWEAGAMDPDAGRNAALAMLGSHPHLTGVLCFSDQLAIGAAQACERLGLSVPGDISLVGFDDVPRASTWDPPLTTVRQPMVDKGRAAAELLLEQIDGGAGPRRVELPIELVVRSSSGPPR
ncbi:MAG: LacI family DNA-binding transcriptional regulator [Actinomycetota bacterium]